jgi:hypothetical protein
MAWARPIQFLGGCLAGALAIHVLGATGYIARPAERDRLLSATSTNPDGEAADYSVESARIARHLSLVDQMADVETVFDRIRILDSETAEGEFELRLLVARLIELDPSLATLHKIDRPGVSKKLALALLDVLGDDDTAIQRILESLPSVDPFFLRGAALSHATKRDPANALSRVLAYKENVFQRNVINTVAMAWAETQPKLALEGADRIGEPRLREAFISNVLSRWAELDSQGFLAYLETSNDALMKLAIPALEVVASSDPERILRIGTRLSRRGQFEKVIGIAVRSLSERDPYAAISRFNDLPPGQERRITREAIAAGFVEYDSVAALSWAQGLNPPSPKTVENVLAVISQMDVERVFELAVSNIAQGKVSGVDFRNVFPNASLDTATMRRIGSQIATLRPDQTGSLGPHFAQMWSKSDPEAALDWALRNGDVGAQMLPHIALNYQGVSFERAMAQVDRIPIDYRLQWIQGIAVTTGISELRTSPERFARVIARFESDPKYAGVIDILVNATTSAARFDKSIHGSELAQSLPQGKLRQAIENAAAERP